MQAVVAEQVTITQELLALVVSVVVALVAE